MPTAVAGSRLLNKSKWFQEVGYKPHLGQQVIHRDKHRHRVLCNGRRWGKTFLGAHEVEPTAFVFNRLGEPQFGWIVGPQFSDCEKEFRIVYNTLKKLGVDQVSTKFLNNVDNGNMVIETKWGWHLECRSAKHPETLTGEGLDFVLMVEAGKHRRKTWTEYIRPALSDKRGWSLHSGVPEGATQTSLLYALWLRGQQSEGVGPWKSWRMPSWTNTVVFPGGRQDPEILDAEADLTDEEFRRQYGAEFVDRIGRVMQEWDDEIHIRDLRYTKGWPLYLAVDFGFTNPFVILWVQVDAFNNVYVIKERRWKLKDTKSICEEMLADDLLRLLVQQAVAIYPDPAEPDDAQTMQTMLKIPTRSNTGGLLKTRLDLIRNALKVKNQHLEDGHVDKQPTLVVDRSCTELCWEMREGYRWPEHKSETKNEDENPMDKDNHGVEALGRFFKGYMSLVEVKQGGGARQSKMKYSSGAKPGTPPNILRSYGGR